MATRYSSLSKPTISFIKCALNKPSLKPTQPFSFPLTRSPLTQSRVVGQLGCLESLLPLHSAVSSSRLTSCLGIDSRKSRSLSQELGLSVPR